MWGLTPMSRPASLAYLRTIFQAPIREIRVPRKLRMTKSSAFALASPGLSSSIYTKDLTQAFEYINTVEAGMVHVNAPTLGGEVHLPFGGLKSSGVGQREQGVEAFEFFSEVITGDQTI